MNVLVVLKSLLLSIALKGVLDKEPQKYQTAVACDGAELEASAPDQIVVDAGSLNGPLIARWPDAKVILIDTGLEEEAIVDLLCSYRIDGVISTDSDDTLFKKALEVIGAGQAWIDNGKVRAILTRMETAAKETRKEKLSKKEQEIIIQVSQGLKNREIAERLFVSEQTVKAHLSRIFRKCKVKTRAQLVPLALRLR